VTNGLTGLSVAVVFAVLFLSVVEAQDAVYKAPAAADWTALAKLPDFSGVWEAGGGGGGGRGRGGPPAGPQLTPAADRQRRLQAPLHECRARIWFRQ
jgi:hypothetical protein